jgi:hypothetical protein
MSEVLQANIFFYIASVATIVFSILLCIAMYYVIKIVRSINKIVERIDAGSESIKEDISQLRTYLAEGSWFSHIIGLFGGSQKRRRKKAEDDNS